MPEMVFLKNKNLRWEYRFKIYYSCLPNCVAVGSVVWGWVQVVVADGGLPTI